MMRVLGIDPGLRITGYGCIDVAGAKTSVVEAGVFRLGAGGRGRSGDERLRGDAKTVSSRLLELDEDVRALIERLKPEMVAVEALFAHYKHPATAIVMGHARGVILLAIRRAGLELVELKPAAVKKSLTGNGQASKEQMQLSVRGALGLAQTPEPADVADALAIALCAAWRTGAGARGATL